MGIKQWLKQWILRYVLENVVLLRYSKIATLIGGISLVITYGWWGLVMFMPIAFLVVAWSFWYNGSFAKMEELAWMLKAHKKEKKEWKRRKKENDSKGRSINSSDTGNGTGTDVAKNKIMAPR